MSKTNILKRSAAVAVGLGTLTCASNIITHIQTSKMRLPASAALIIGTFVLGAIVMDAAQTGIESQIDEIAKKVKKRKK